MTKVFLLTIDALRYDILCDDKVPTPNIDRLLEESIFFERAFSNGCGTPAAFPAILYSSKQNVGNTAPNKKSIASYFQEYDFETIGITSNPYTSSYYGYDSGFDLFMDYVKPTSEKEESSLLFRLGRKTLRLLSPLYTALTGWRAKHSLPYERAEKINAAILKHLKSDKNQFIWAHYMDPHAPYSPPQSYRDYCPEAFKQRGKLMKQLYSGNVDKESRELLWELYKTEVRYLDDQLGELLNKISEAEDKVYIIFTSDHGEEFGERGKFQHCQFFEFNIHVPLGFYTPNKDQRSEEKLASHLDIIPTILSELGLPVDNAAGIDLFSESRDHLVINFRDKNIIITEDWKLIDDEQPYLFDISDSLSEGENLYEKRPDIVKELQKLTSPTSNIDF